MNFFLLAIFSAGQILISTETNPNMLFGTVSDAEHHPIAYAHLGIIGVPKGTITDESGRFRFNISGMSDEDSLFVSAIGYKTQKYGFSELSPEKEMDITLEKETYTQDEIQVTARKRNLIHFGRDKSGGNSGWVYSGIATGNEAGMVFSNNKKVILSAFKFHVNTADFDSLMYRIHVYEIANDKLIPLNKTEIRKTSPVKTGWVAIELGDYQLSTNRDFAVTAEVLKGWKGDESTKRGKIKFTGRNALSKQMLQRSHRFMKAEMTGLKLNMAVDAVDVR